MESLQNPPTTMVTREQILETQRKCEEIRKNSKCRIMDESQFNFKTMEEMIKFYNAEPFEEFDKRFRSGAYESDERRQPNQSEAQRNLPKWMKGNYVKVTKTVERAFMDYQFQLLSTIHFVEQLDEEDLAIARELAVLQERFRNEVYDREAVREMFEKEREMEDSLLSHCKKKGFPKMVFEEGGKVGVKDFKGDVLLPAEFEDILLTYEKASIFDPRYIIALKYGMWGLVDKYGNEILPFDYGLIFPIENDNYGVKQNGKWGIYNALSNKWELPCKHDQIYTHEPSPMSIYIFSDNGKFGWTGCQLKENDAEAEYDAVYLPSKEYFYSEEYGDESETFEAIKDGVYHEIEYWTFK